MYVVGLVPDNEVRVSVKALAVSCVGAAAALLPEAFFNKLYLQPLDGQQPDGEKYTDNDPVSSIGLPLFCFDITFCFFVYFVLF